MRIRDLAERNRSRGFDLLFIMVSDIQNGNAYLDKYFVNEREYNYFAEALIGDNNESHGYSYAYRKQRVNFYEFANLLDLPRDEADTFALIDAVNQQLKNIAIHCNMQNEEEMVEREYRNKIMVNLYFDDRQIIPEKRRETFPLAVPEFNAIDDRQACFRMFNVGQGCMSALYIEGIPCPPVIFDIGCSRKCKSAINLLNFGLSYCEDCPTTIVISHFDDDHINMAKYLPMGGANLQFFMPEFLHPSDIYKPNIQLLLSKAIVNGNKVCFFLNDNLHIPLPLNYLSILQGSSHKRDINQSTDENSHGLIVLFEHHGETIMIPGDALYKDIFTAVAQPIRPDYVVLPHHCCEYLSSVNSHIIDINYVKEAFAFCGPHGGFHHPNATHFMQYLANRTRLIRLKSIRDRGIVYDRSRPLTDSFFISSPNDYYDWIM